MAWGIPYPPKSEITPPLSRFVSLMLMFIFCYVFRLKNIVLEISRNGILKSQLYLASILFQVLLFCDKFTVLTRVWYVMIDL